MRGDIAIREGEGVGKRAPAVVLLFDIKRV